MAAENYDGPEPVNLGTGFEITIKNLSEKIKQLTCFKGKIILDTSKPDGQPRRRLDIAKARELFGFKPAVTFDQGLQQTVGWWRTCGI